MPISDSNDYSSGHFKRVYDHIIKPACLLSKFEPIRADDVKTTNFIALDIIKQIIDCDMAICDLSSQNPNVLYELGIRQAFNLPVTLIRDSKTDRVFDIQGFRDIKYDETLRIDTVEKTIQEISAVINNTYTNKNTEINSLVSLLAIEPAKVNDKKEISADTQLILNSIATIEDRIRLIENKGKLDTRQIVQNFPHFPENVGSRLQLSDFENISVGTSLFHHRYGVVMIEQIQKTDLSYILSLRLENGQSRMMEVNSISAGVFRFLN